MNKVYTRLDLLRALPKDGTVAELGVYRGGLSRGIIDICSPKLFYMVDLWEQLNPPWPSYAEQHQNRLNVERDFNKSGIFIVQEDTREFLESHSDGFFDWIYLDSCHRYEHVMSEMIVAESKIKPGGYICGHDYSEKIGRGAIIRAVRDFCKAHNWHVAIVTVSDNFNSFAIQRNHEPGK